jgi:SAM-dependent methyltransferase
MDSSLYPRMAEVEDTHWWFAGRRAICECLINRVKLPLDCAILEPGCGTGGNFAMLSRRGRLYAMDTDEAALHFAAARGLADLARGWLPDNIPFDGVRFDLVVMTDVLEHLDDETGSLRAVHARLKPGGSLLITVPAMRWLWSEHDTTHHHRRRYRAADLSRLMSGAGFTVDYLSYYNFILFPAIVAIRTLQRIRATRSNGVNRHDLAMPPAIVNAILFRLFSSERYVVGTLRVPLGVSLILLAHA